MGNFSSRHIPKILVVCDQTDTASLWGYILRQQGLIAILESRVGKAIEYWSAQKPDLVVIDLDETKQDPIQICKTFRTTGMAPILLFLPVYNELQIMDAYAAGVDDVLVKPVSYTIFIPKLIAWVRRSGITPLDSLNLINAGKYRLVHKLRCFVDPNDVQIKLSNLEFRLLQLLMSRPGHTFMTEEIIETIWGGYANGDHVLLKNVVYRLRRKIEADPGNPVIIRTFAGGYSFQC